MNPYIRHFQELTKNDIAIAGGKNASLGEMYSKLSSKGISVPEGFAVTADAFKAFLSYNQLEVPIKQLLNHLDTKTFANLGDVSSRIKDLIANAVLPDDLKDAVVEAYLTLGAGTRANVAVRSSATAEDLPSASFAGQHESFLNIHGKGALLTAVKACFASLYTDRAIKYRQDKGFPHDKVFLSVGVQKMIKADTGCSGVIFTLEPETGFRDVVHISGVWGLGENIVQGTVTPDEFFVFKPTLLSGRNAIVRKKLGSKDKTMIYGDAPGKTVLNIDTPQEKQERFILSNEEVTRLAHWAMTIENHYGMPMDIEWVKDGITGKIFILQARPETVHTQKKRTVSTSYILKEKGSLLCQGESVGNKIATGIARIIASPQEAFKLKAGEIVVTDMTSPDWDPILKKSAAIVTNKGGRTSHASIVAREFGVPAIVGCINATGEITDGEMITVSCAQGKTGYVYKGALSFETVTRDPASIHLPESTKVMLIAADPDKAFELSFLPSDGIGLLRIELMITHSVQVHPLALARFSHLKDTDTINKIESLTKNYSDKAQYFVEKLSEGIAMMASAFYPREVIVRMSDFKTNEYANLIGGKLFEPEEENPMLGFRGASRYYSDQYKDGFRLECLAIKRVREEMGLTNVKVMIPFCRAVEEGVKVLEVMKTFGLEQGHNFLEIYMMAEIPSNVILADKFANLFDGFSIGSNDLTQLTLGVDRDSSIVSSIFNEENEAAKWMIAEMISHAKKASVKIGLCGQAPSDFPAFARFLVECGIDSISFNEDALLKGIDNINKAEHTLVSNSV